MIKIMAKHHCQIENGGYGAWSEYGACSVTCGEGIQERKRFCDNPFPKFGGESCEKLELGPSIETKACKMESCPGEDVTFLTCFNNK